MADLELQDGSAGLAAVVFEAADGCGDTVPSGVHAGSWQKPVLLLVRNTGALDCCCDPVLVKVYVSVTGHDECCCCEPIAAQEFEVPSDGGIGVIPIRHKGLGQRVTVEYADAMDLEVAVVNLIPGYIITPLEPECCC